METSDCINKLATLSQKLTTSYGNGFTYSALTRMMKVYGNTRYNLYDQTCQADWGYNQISNGSNSENNGWRTLTREEWGYVLNTRATAFGIRYAKANVNSVDGVILLPDDWSASYLYVEQYQ